MPTNRILILINLSSTSFAKHAPVEVEGETKAADPVKVITYSKSVKKTVRDFREDLVALTPGLSVRRLLKFSPSESSRHDDVCQARSKNQHA